MDYIDDFTGLDDWIAQDPGIFDDPDITMPDDRNVNNGNADTTLINPQMLALDNQFTPTDLNNFTAPEQLHPVAQMAAALQMPAATMGPCYHPQVGWYYPTAPPANVPPPPGMMMPMGSVQATPTIPQAMPFAVPQIPTAALPAPMAPPAAKASQASKARPPPAAPSSGTSRPRPHRANTSIVQVCLCKPEATRIKRPRNAFMCFRSANSARLMKESGTSSNQVVSARAGQEWRCASEATKQHFHEMAEQEKARHQQMYPDYKYNPGDKAARQFGDADCTCGAYEANSAHARAKGQASLAADDQVDGDRAYVPPRGPRPQRPAPTAVMTAASPPTLDIDALGLPTGRQAREAAALYASAQKRKHNTLAINTTPPQTPRKRRSTRATASKVNYHEPNEDEIPFDLDAEKLFDFNAASKPRSQSFQPSPKDMRSSRRSSSKTSESLFVSPSGPLSPIAEAPAPSMKDKGKKTQVAVEDDDDVGEEIVVAPRSTRSTAQRRVSQESSSVRRSTRRTGK